MPSMSSRFSASSALSAFQKNRVIGGTTLVFVGGPAASFFCPQFFCPSFCPLVAAGSRAGCSVMVHGTLRVSAFFFFHPLFAHAAGARGVLGIIPYDDGAAASSITRSSSSRRLSFQSGQRKPAPDRTPGI